MSKQSAVVKILEKPRVARGIQIGAAVLSLALSLVALTVQRHVLGGDHEGVTALQLAVIFALGASGCFLVITALQSLQVGNFTQPTKEQIRGDLLASVWGLPFSVPLAFAALNGTTATGSDWWMGLLLVVAGMVFPAIRPRWLRAG